jgi:threonyl-tRNA synthetase
MSEVRVILPDNSEKIFPHEPTVLEVAQSIGAGLAKATVGGMLDGSKEVVDLRTQVKDGQRLSIVTTKSPEAIEVVRHSTAHLLAQAVQELWPDIKVTIGPVIADGFYYDFDSPRPFTEADLEKIEAKMKEIVKRKDEVTKEVWSQEKAVEVFGNMGERFKVEIIQDLGEKEVSVYKQGEWFDLCRGPHVQNIGDLKVFKLLSVASAYWRGDEKNDSLQRIYGTAFTDKKELNEYLERIEEAKKRDHRKLGKELQLFHFHEYAPGMPFFTSKGTVIYNELVDLIRELYLKYGYQEVITPQIFDTDLFKQSGHYDNYLENMYFTEVDEREFSFKPMNCPGHCLHFKNHHFSYRDLPFRVADFGRLHRYERSGALHGLTRVRSFSQDDAHIFCTMDQLIDEIKGFMNLLNEVYTTLDMTNYRVFLSTRPEKRLGSDEVWDKSEAALKEALETLGLEYEINEGDGAFYGPKLDIMFVDALKRDWQLGTLQLDYNLPDRFELSYIGDDNTGHQPVMLHRAILGSVERFIGVYLEHTGGHLPLWLSPEQLRVLNVTDRVNGFCQELVEKFKNAGLRSSFDSRSEKLNYKIREAQLAKIPLMVIVGDKEAEKGVVSIRTSKGETFQDVSVESLLDAVKDSVENRNIENPLRS